MKQFNCGCGQAIFFDSDRCVACGALLGFHPVEMRMLALRGSRTGLLMDDAGREFKLCANGSQYDACNWLVPADRGHPLCTGCRFNRTIPNLDFPKNLRRWRRFEVAKKRLLFSLLNLGLPLNNGFDDPANGLLLDFIEDQRSNPNHFPESFVHTGFHGGVITINAMEADDDVRESIRAEMNESYRTLLGHLRHESGHYYWGVLVRDAETSDHFTSLFGDPGMDYQEALEKHYANGPDPGWCRRFISAYASSHPLEDWAETWGHYLLIHDALETAVSFGIGTPLSSDLDMNERIATWSALSITLNELNRSSGLGDAYPFVVNKAVAEKLTFVDEIIRRSQSRPPPSAGHRMPA